jgi:hypothetical protein
MMLRNLFVLSTLLVACSNDYDLTPDPSLNAEPNPPDLSAVTKEDRIVQVTVPSVDVLWVIDNSCSMTEEQQALSDNFGKFVQYFVGSGLDYHIGVVSTDWDNESGDHRGKLQVSGGKKWIDDTTADPEGIFKDMAVLGTWGSAYEKGRAQAYGAIELLGDSFNSGFYREDAFLAIVSISDEDDYSGNTPVGLNEFISWLDNLKPAEDMVSFSSIVGPEGGCSTAIETGDEYLAVTRAIGGIEWSICDPNWDQVLEELGMQAAGLKREFYLSEVPVVESVQVRVEEAGDELKFERDVDWEYLRSRNSIRFFSYVPNPLSEVFITYDVLSGEKVTEEVTSGEEEEGSE